MYEFDDQRSPLEDDEYPDEYEADDDWNETELAPCPSCGAEIDENSVQCPICGEYITFSTSAWDGKSWWWIVLGIAGVAGTCLALALF